MAAQTKAKRPFGGKPRFAPEGTRPMAAEDYAATAARLAEELLGGVAGGYVPPPSDQTSGPAKPRARVRYPLKVQMALECLGLDEMPDATGIRKAYRRASMTAHPDQGGSHAAFIAVRQAFELLAKLYATGRG
jgi:DnaJ-class molecular chaperone